MSTYSSSIMYKSPPSAIKPKQLFIFQTLPDETTKYHTLKRAPGKPPILVKNTENKDSRDSQQRPLRFMDFPFHLS